jgi:hypothetical protein
MTMSKEWNPWFYEWDGAAGTAVCVEHRGRHEWEAMGPREGDWFCLGLESERIQARLSATAHGDAR